MLRSSLLLSVVCSLILLSGCRFGGASFTGDLGGQAFEPGGTVFAYVDESDDNFVAEDRPRVVVVMTWIVFDPTLELNDRSGSDLEDMSHEAALRDAMALVFDDQGDVISNASFTSIREGDDELGNGDLAARIHLTPERLDGSSTYSAFQPFASHVEVDASISAANFDEGLGQELRGALSVELSRTDRDPGDARIGSVSGEFVAPLVNERIAEQNLSLLDLDVLVGVPLPPRGEP